MNYYDVINIGKIIIELNRSLIQHDCIPARKKGVVKKENQFVTMGMTWD